MAHNLPADDEAVIGCADVWQFEPDQPGGTTGTATWFADDAILTARVEVETLRATPDMLPPHLRREFEEGDGHDRESGR